MQMQMKMMQLLVPDRLDPEKTQTEPRRSKRTRIEKVHEDFYALLVEESPCIFEGAMKSSNSPFQKEAIDNEIQYTIQNHTWELTDLPPSCKTIGCKWVFKKKLRSDDTVDKIKPKLVAKGFFSEIWYRLFLCLFPSGQDSHHQGTHNLS